MSLRSLQSTVTRSTVRMAVLLMAVLPLRAVPRASAETNLSSTLFLLSRAQVDKTGIYLDQISAVAAPGTVPHVRIASAPAVGQAVTATRAQIQQILRQNPATVQFTNWAGAPQITIVRRTRALGEKELQDLLTTTLRREILKNDGDLELRLSHPWAPLLIPDEPVTAKIFDLPPTGVSASFMLHFSLLGEENQLGTWQIPVQASLYKEVVIARGHLRRGELLRSADTGVEKRDIFSLRDPLEPGAVENGAFELTENIPPNYPVLARSVRVHPVIRRGSIIEAVLQDGAINISCKVQALEDGLPGQTVRVRNLKSKHEFYGKVQNEATVLVSL